MILDKKYIVLTIFLILNLLKKHIKKTSQVLKFINQVQT